MPIILTILGISALIFIHEAGHFLCARLAGVRVHVFSLGFGRRLWGFVHKGTDYRISMLPLGGYVQVAGEDPTADRSTLYRDDLHSKGFLARTFFYSGGVIMNLLFALIVFPLVFRSGVEFDSPVLGEVIEGGAGWEADLQRGDRILAVNGKEMYSFVNMRVEVALASAKKGVEIAYERDGTRETSTLHPRYDRGLGLREIHVDLPYLDGPYEVDVDEKSAAYEAGLRDGDVLFEFDGKPVTTPREQQTAEEAWSRRVGRDPKRPLTIKIRRPAQGGKPEEKTLQFSALPTDESTPRLGILQAGRKVIGLKQGFPAIAALGIERQDEIQFVNSDPFVGQPLDFGSKPGPVTVVVKREGGEDPVVLQAAVPVADRQGLANAIALGPADGPIFLKPVIGGAADLAGVQRGDRLNAINGEPVESWPDLVEIVRGNAEKPLTLAITRAAGQMDIVVTPRRDANLGFLLKIPRHRYIYQVEGVGEALSAGFTASIDFVKQVYVTLKKLFTGEVSTKNLGGIITIARVSYYTAQEGYARLFYFLAMLSINLAVFNVLPIPVLDGGHLMFLLIERIKGSPVSTTVHTYSQILGLVFVLLLLIYVTYNDILKLNIF